MTIKEKTEAIREEDFCRGCGAEGGQGSFQCECCGHCGSNNCHGACVEE